MIDTTSTLIPGLGGAISSYKRLRAERNLKILIYQLHKRQGEIISNLKKQSDDNKDKLDKLLEIVLIATEEFQEEKINYLVNGYVNLTRHIEITSDFVMYYYETLKQLRLVDLSVLRLYYRNSYYYSNDESYETFQTVMNKHGMSYDQYTSVRENLIRNGLLEREIKDEQEKDRKALEDGINRIIGYIKHINGKSKMSPPKLTPTKIKQKSKEVIKINRFGKDFYKFFCEL
ncbi:hypothetical protein [Shouchella miscanthi]|uniref:hypothetical protein n=1 Tax=Shouchella miscanthi TaxID=2598861 RepID=UPI0011A46EB8|nr:hypothetical protein [Shouchella miscanthi]